MGRRVHLLCNAHLDPAWQWRLDEGIAAAIATFRSAADLCESDGALVFNHNEAILYQWIETHEPALFQRIRRLSAAGRWVVVGGWHLQPDCNLPSGESLVRQVLRGRHYFRERLGQVPRTAFNPDPFGHSRGLVRILAESGYRHYIFMRPESGLLDLPAEDFTWQGYAGADVLAHRIHRGYNSPMGKAADKIRTRLSGPPAASVSEPGDDRPVLVLWGVGNHGGGPSRKDLADIGRLADEARDQGVEILHSDADAYFRDLVEAGMPMPPFDAALRPSMTGCYTSMIRVKQAHRALENRLRAMEKTAAAAFLAGFADPDGPGPDFRKALRSAEEDLMLSQFHDILPGSAVQSVEEESLRLLSHGMETLERERFRLLYRFLVGEPVAEEGTVPIFAWNPHPYPVHSLVDCEFMLQDQNWSVTRTVATVLHQGRHIPSQMEKEESNIPLDWRKRVVFQATLPPCALSRFDCRLSEEPADPRPVLSPVTGSLADTLPRLDPWLDPDALSLLVLEDSEDSWGMQRASYGDLEGRFRIASRDEAARIRGLPPGSAGAEAVRIVEDGPVRRVSETVLTYGGSAAVLRLSVPAGRGGAVLGQPIEVDLRLFWNERDRMAKLSIPLGTPAIHFRAQDAYGTADLPLDGTEHPIHQWASLDLADGARLTVVNEGCAALDAMPGELRMTLLRSPAYCAHPIDGRPTLEQDRFSPRMDLGERRIRLWLLLESPGSVRETPDRVAQALNETPWVLSAFPGGCGSRLPGGLFRLQGDDVLLTAFKPAEDGKGFILRLYNPALEPRTVRLDLPTLGLSRELSFGPDRIRTFRLLDGRLDETDLMEGLLEPGTVPVGPPPFATIKEEAHET